MNKQKSKIEKVVCRTCLTSIETRKGIITYCPECKEAIMKPYNELGLEFFYYWKNKINELEKGVFDLEEVVIDKESQIDNLKRGVREIFRDIENMENVFNTGEGQKEYKQIKKKHLKG